MDVEWWPHPAAPTATPHAAIGPRHLVPGPVLGDHFEDILPFLKWALARGQSVLFFQGDSAFLRRVQLFGRECKVAVDALPIGREAIVELHEWNLGSRRLRRVRSQARRARRLGVELQRVSADLVPSDSALVAHLQGLREQWLSVRRMSPLHFVAKPRLAYRASEHFLYIAWQRERAVGLLSTFPYPKERTWFLEDLWRSPNAPHGTNELLTASLIEDLAQREHDGAVSLGLLPLYGIEASSDDARVRLMLWCRSHLQALYNFDGLNSFKLAFQPDVREVQWVVAIGEPLSLPSIWALTRAFTGNAPLTFFLDTLRRQLQRRQLQRRQLQRRQLQRRQLQRRQLQRRQLHRSVQCQCLRHPCCSAKSGFERPRQSSRPPCGRPAIPEKPERTPIYVKPSSKELISKELGSRGGKPANGLGSDPPQRSSRSR